MFMTIFMSSQFEYRSQQIIMHMKPRPHPWLFFIFSLAKVHVDGNPFNQQRFTCVPSLGTEKKKNPYGKCMKSQTAITGWWGRLRENGHSTNCITTPHHETPPGAYDGFCVLQCESAGVDFALKGQCVGMFSNTIILVQYYKVGALLLQRYIQYLSLILFELSQALTSL